MRGAERSQSSLTPAERELESALRELRPAASRIDRDKLLFDAGAATARTRMQVSRWTAVALVAALGLALLWRPQPEVVERVRLLPGISESPAGQMAQVDRNKLVTPSTAPVMVASMNGVPFPVPGGPFVAVPRGFVGRMGLDTGALPAAYLGKIQGVVRNGWTALPPARGRTGANTPDGESGVTSPAAAGGEQLRS